MGLKERQAGSGGHFDDGGEIRVSVSVRARRNMCEAVVGLDGAEERIAGRAGFEGALGGLGEEQAGAVSAIGQGELYAGYVGVDGKQGLGYSIGYLLGGKRAFEFVGGYEYGH